jgi:hypothetical protein
MRNWITDKEIRISTGMRKEMGKNLTALNFSPCLGQGRSTPEKPVCNHTELLKDTGAKIFGKE